MISVPFSVHTIIYICHILFPKLRLSHKRFKIVSQPAQFIQVLLDELSLETCVDINSCVVVGAQQLLSSFAKLKDSDNSESKPRFVQIFSVSNSIVKKNEIHVSDNLKFNLTHSNKIRDDVNVSFANASEAPLASDVEVSQVHTFCDIASEVIDTMLKQYFATPRLLYKDDIVSIDVKEYAGQRFFTNKQVNEVRTVYFKIRKILLNDHDQLSYSDCAICVADCSGLKLSSNVQSLIPEARKLVAYNFYNDNYSTIDSCPFGLTEYFEDLKASITPFLKKSDLKLHPMFLIQGGKGCGKHTIITSVTAALGLHLYKITSVDVCATSYSQVESKLRSLLFKIKLMAPCIFVIDNFENFGKNHEGLYDQRIIYNFYTEMQNLFKSNDHPVIVVCISNQRKIHSDLKRTFLRIIDIRAPTPQEREGMLRWLLQYKGFNIKGDLLAVASKCHGFYYEDLEALVFHALKMKYSNGFEGFIEEDYFFKALDLLQSNFIKTMGAPKVPKVEWSDIGGLHDIKREIIKTVQLPLKHPEYFNISGLKRSGILLYGPPGTGKTLIAKAVATECNLCFLSVKGPELLNMYVGQSEENIRNVFQRAREAAPCIIFFDELDSLAPNRGATGDSGGVMDRVVSQLLAEMDGLNKSATVIIIGATNRPDLLDPALLRPGRFDKLLYVGPCNTEESKLSVLQALTKKFKLSDDVDLREIVNSCPENITGADYYGLCSEAWMAAVRRLIKASGDCNDVYEPDEVIVSKNDFFESIGCLRPSVKVEDLQYFERLQNEFSTN